MFAFYKAPHCKNATIAGSYRSVHSVGRRVFSFAIRGTQLQRRGAQVNYVRTPAGFEVDFYARGLGGNEALIQVCADLDSPDTLARGVRALQHAART